MKLDPNAEKFSIKQKSKLKSFELVAREWHARVPKSVLQKSELETKEQ